MGKLRVLVSLTTDDNDYQQLQAADAEQTAQSLGIELKIAFAKNDAVEQSKQLLTAMQSSPELRPNGIILEPVGTGLLQVARGAVSAGIGWAVLNREVDYIKDLRTNSVPVFTVISDHEQIGRIQGLQIAALLPHRDAVVLQIEGPTGDISGKRTKGMLTTKPTGIQVRNVRGQWTENSAYRAVASWLDLSVSRELPVALVAAQDDSMAMGTRKAIKDKLSAQESARWLRCPFLGCDGLPLTGQAWVDSGLLGATIVVPSNTGPALRMMVNSLRTGLQPSEHTMTLPASYPPLEQLSPRRG